MIAKNEFITFQIADFALRNLLRRLPHSKLSENAALWWGYRYRPHMGVVPLRSGAVIKTSRVDHLELLLYYLGTFEPKALEEMRSHLQSGDTILDVGANVGVFSIEGAKAVGPRGRVIAIEAAPHHARYLGESASLNRFSNIEINNVAVGEADGEATLTRPVSGNAGTFTLGKVDGNESFKVSVRRIDDIVGSRPVHLIKMDIEGSEMSALRGATMTLRRSRPTILIELNDAALQRCGSSAREVKQFLFSMGYVGRIVGSKRTITFDEKHDCDECIFVAG